MSRLLLLRHGQSVWNALRRWQGTADPPLSGEGRRQSELAATRLEDIDEIWASDLLRAAGTAEIIAAAHGLSVLLTPAMRERHAGAWQGHTRVEIENKWPGALDAWETPDDWEDDAALFGRAMPFVAGLGGADDRNTVVITHTGVINSVDRHFRLERNYYPNLSGRWLDVDGDGVQPGEAVQLIDSDEDTRRLE